MSRDSQVGSYTIYWYQQKAGESPKYLLYNTGSNGRFTGSKDASANAAYLTITNLQDEDEGDYYCGGAYGSGSNFRSQLTVYLDSACGTIFSPGTTSKDLIYHEPRRRRSSSQPTVIQESSISPSPGQTVKLSCSLSSGQVTNYEQSWYQQKDGGSPRFLYYYYSSATAGSGDLSRFSASKESNQNKWYLTIQNIQPEDEAHYYCAVWYGSSSQPTVIQESSMSPSPGQTVKLSCSLSSGQVTNYAQSWYQQKDGGSPRFLYYYYSSAAAGSGDLSRFSASKESNQNKWYLTIQNIQPEDEAHYYCAVWYGSSSQPTVIQESSMSPSPGQTVKLSCSLSSGQVTNYAQSWYQQKDGGSPRFLYYYYSSATAGSGDLSRFSASKESNQNKWYLTIQNIQPEDEAHYYCAVWYGSSSQPTVIQESSMSPSPGQTVKLSCSLSSGQVTNYYQSWYQQKDGGSPRFLYRYYSSAAAGSGDLSRFSASKESNQNKWYLTIQNIQPEDEANYYCAVWYGSSSQPTVIQESSISPSPGQTVKLSCSLSSGQVTNYGQSWYQQKDGGSPRFLYYYYSSAAAGSGDLSRFSASKESNQNKWYLTIQDIRPEDEADYYCAVWYGSSSQPTVIQECSISPSRGQMVKLSCSLSSGQVTNYYQSWYQQKEGGSPRFLYHYYSSATASSGDLSHFSASKESNHNKWYLTIQDIQPEDQADYYCSFHTDSDKGQGSGVPSRFSGSKEASTNAGYLTISGVMDEDEADYYCATWYSNEFHSGTF
ncbi:hypothetical protein E2320_012623 [Naja naja]|nr:hypothetical protein E2320_012623 [Naja naja]